MSSTLNLQILTSAEREKVHSFINTITNKQQQIDKIVKKADNYSRGTLSNPISGLDILKATKDYFWINILHDEISEASKELKLLALELAEKYSCDSIDLPEPNDYFSYPDVSKEKWGKPKLKLYTQHYSNYSTGHAGTTPMAGTSSSTLYYVKNINNDIVNLNTFLIKLRFKRPFSSYLYHKEDYGVINLEPGKEFEVRYYNPYLFAVLDNVNLKIELRYKSEEYKASYNFGKMSKLFDDRILDF